MQRAERKKSEQLLILDAVSETIADYGFISVVSVDGPPSLVAADSYDIPEQYKKASESKLRADAKNKAHNLMMQVVGVRADDGEVDTLEAIRIAVRSFDSAEEMADRKIIVVDTGWCTTGLMNFGNNLLNGDPEAVAKMLDERNDVRELSKARADAVKRSLLEMGVEEERVVTTGLGNGDPWHIYGVGTKGDLAAQNRKVVMLGADSDEAAEIMGMKP